MLAALDRRPGLSTQDLLAAVADEVGPLRGSTRAVLVDRLLSGEVAGAVSHGRRPVRWYPAGRAPAEPGRLFDDLPGETADGGPPRTPDVPAGGLDPAGRPPR